MSDEDPGPSQRRYRFDDDRPPKNVRFSEEEIAEIRKMSMEGATAAAIGAKLGRHQSTVITYMRKLREAGVEGLVPPGKPKLPPETIRRIIDLKAQSMKHTDIAVLVGRSRSSVSRILQDAASVPKPQIDNTPREIFPTTYATAFGAARARYRGIERDRKPGDTRPVTISQEEYVSIFVQGSCLTCGRDNKSLAYGVDRLFPDLGYVPGNCSCMCWDCNSTKGGRDVVTFVRQSQDIAHFEETGEIGPNADAWPKFLTGSSFIDYVYSAKKRGLIRDLNESEYYDICFRPCSMCGRPPDPMHGVDRVDSSKGYVVGNCAPACSVCNIAKKDTSVDTYIEISRRTASRAAEILDLVVKLRAENGIGAGDTMKHPLPRLMDAKWKDTLEAYASTGLSTNLENLARLVNIHNISSIHVYFAKIRVFIAYNPEWFVREYGNIPVLPEHGPVRITDDEKSMIIAMAKEGRPDCYIATELGRCLSAIGRCINEYTESGGTGVRPAKALKVTPAEESRMLEMADAGAKHKYIARELGRSPTSVRNILIRLRHL